MKNRIAASLALAVGVALGASGCSLVAHNGTTVAYAPSDGVQTTVADVAFRNVLLITDEDGDNLNVVFTAVNNSGKKAKATLNFQAENAEAAIDVNLQPGTTSFGNSEKGDEVLVATLKGVTAGQAVKTYFTVNGEGDDHEFVPVLDGTLKEYRPYVLTKADIGKSEAIDLAKLTESEIADAAKAAGETVEDFTARVTAAAKNN